MSAFWGVVRLEARLRRRDLLACGAALAGVLAAALCGMLGPQEAGSSEFLRGGVLLMIVILGVVRTIAAHRPWRDLRVALPLADRPRVFGRLGVRALLALMVGVAYARWASPGGDSPLVHITTTFLWLLLAGEALSLLLHLRGGGSERIALLLGIISVFTLLESWNAVLGDSRSTSGPMQSLGLLCMLGFVVVCALAITPEWLPTSAPKALRPRPRLLGGLLRRKPMGRSPSQVLQAMGGAAADLRRASMPIYLYGLALFCGMAVEHSAYVGVTAVIFGGLHATVTLTDTCSRWANLRAYPIRAQDIWVKPIGRVVAVLLGGMVLAVLLGPVLSKPRIAPQHAGRTRSAVELPELRAPEWARVEEATHHRPPGMPAPRSGGPWPLRSAGIRWVSRGEGDERAWSPRPAPASSALQHTQPRQYFHASLRYYLHLVHGVAVTTTELDEALGEPLRITESPAYIPLAHYVEYVESAGTHLASYRREARLGQVRVHVYPHDRRSAHQPAVPVSPPLALYTFTPALKRLEKLLGPRLVRAAHWSFAFDLVLLVLLYLAFVRLALIAGPMRWALPLLPLLVAGAWSGSRANATHLAIRDAHLADPWMMVVTAVLLGATLVWSISKQLGRLSQTSTPA